MCLIIKTPAYAIVAQALAWVSTGFENLPPTLTILHHTYIHNVYDKTAISILYEGFIIGYVPNNDYVKELCKNNISDNLIIINIKQIKHNIGIRVIPETFYKKDKNLEREVFFSDDF